MEGITRIQRVMEASQMDINTFIVAVFSVVAQMTSGPGCQLARANGSPVELFSYRPELCVSFSYFLRRLLICVGKRKSFPCGIPV